MLMLVQGGEDLGLFEVNEAARLVQEAAHPEANIIFGNVIDSALGDEVRVTVIAAGFDPTPKAERESQPLTAATPAAQTAAAPQAAAATQAAREDSPAPEAPEVEAEQKSDIPQELPDERDDFGGDSLDIPSFLK